MSEGLFRVAWVDALGMRRTEWHAEYTAAKRREVELLSTGTESVVGFVSNRRITELLNEHIEQEPTQ